MLKLCDSTHNSSTIHSAVQSSHYTLRRTSCTLMQAHTHPSAAIYAPPVHTHTRTLPCTPLHTQLSHLHTHTLATTHPYTYLQISTKIKPTIVTMPIYKYLQISTHAYLYKYLQISTHAYLYKYLQIFTLLHYSTYHLNVYSFSLL